MNSSWCVRVDRDELFELQVDGTEGSAVAGLRECRIQPAAATPMPVWNPDIPSPIDHRAAWQRVPDRGEHDNGFKIQWEKFLRHVAFDEPFPWDFLEAAKGIQLAELGMQSWERAPLRRGPGAHAVSVATTTLRLPREGGAIEDVHARRAPSPYTPPHAPAAHPDRVRRRARRRRPARARRPRRPGAARLGGDARVPPPPVVARLPRRRGDGHRAARHGPRLGDDAGADPRARSPRRRRSAAGSPPARAPTTSRPARSLDAVRAAYEEQCAFVESHRRPGDPDGEPRARRRGDRPRRLRGVYAHVLGQLERPAILHWLGPMFDPALARLLGRRRPRRGGRDDARRHRRATRTRSTASRSRCSTTSARSRSAARSPTACASTPATTSTTRS